MSSIRRIVAATDFSFNAHRAARRAGVLAKEQAAALRLLHILNRPTGKALKMMLGASPDIEYELLGEAQRALESLAQDVVAAGGTVDEREVREGAVIDEILAAAAEADLLVLGPRGLNPVQDFVLGTTAERIARMIVQPLLLVKQDPAIRYEHVFVPVDFSEHSLPALKFARTLAPQAVIHVFHAFDCPFEGRLRSAGVPEDAISEYSAATAREAHASMAELLERAQDRGAVPLVERGDARSLITARANDHGCTLIVMGKQGRSWLSEFILGSITRLMLERSACDVLVVPQPRPV